MKDQTLEAWDRKPWRQSKYKGRLILQTPVDLVLFSELIECIRPELIFEFGVLEGGFTRWLVDQCIAHRTKTCIVGIDRTLPPDVFDKPAEFGVQAVGIEGDTLELNTVSQVRKIVQMSIDTVRTKLFIFDDDHLPKHVLSELTVYSDLCNLGDRMVVCDTIPVSSLEENVADWLNQNKDFHTFRCDRFGLTNHRGGWIIRVAVGEVA